MRSSSSFLPGGAAGMLVLLLGIGCERAAEPLEGVASPEVVGPEYSASKGLYVPEETRRSIGLRVEDAREEALAGSFEFAVRVYDVARGQARASGLVAPAGAAHLAPGTRLALRDGTGAAQEGRVVDLRAGAAGTEALIELPQTGAVGPGAFLTAVAFVPPQGELASVPAAAVIRSIEGDFVYTVSGEHFVRTPVKPGIENDGRVAITEGLYAGDRVVAEGAMALWLTELAAIKGGHACCVTPPKGK